jgi:hypothetical protein
MNQQRRTASGLKQWSGTARAEPTASEVHCPAQRMADFMIALLIGWLLAAGCAAKPDASAPPAGANPSGAPGTPGRGMAVCVGLNGVDPDHYAGWPGTLAGCENDATDMAAIATQKGFGVKKILTPHATRKAILDEIRAAAGRLVSGDIFMISISAHGDQVPDPAAPPEDGGMDQTWCLYDGQLLDKELYAEWAKFAPGVRILVISDSCHSQGITRMVPRDYALDSRSRAMAVAAAPDAAAAESARRVSEAMGRFSAATTREAQVRVKALPPETSIETYRREKARYDEIVRTVPRPASPIPALVLSITACKNEQLAGDGPSNGVFTAALKQVWAGGTFHGDYVGFHHQIAAAAAAVRPWQDAQRRMIDRQDERYWGQSPFAIAAP